MADRRLIVGEFDPQEADNGKLYGLQPNNATGVAIPAFRYGTNRPTVGDAPGVAFINTTTGIASVWDGNQWNDIAKPDIAVYPDDNTLLADNPSPDTVALSQATGNLFVRVGMEWLALGLRTYPTQAGMVGAAPPDGTLGYAVDTGEFAVRTGGAWAALAHQGVNVGNTAPPNPVQADMWLDTTVAAAPVLKFYDGTNWVASGAQVSTGARPTNPNPGDIYFDLNQARSLEIYVNGAWHLTNEGPLGVIAEVHPLSQAVFHSRILTEFDSHKLTVDLKAGRMYRVTAVLKLHTKTGTKGTWVFDVEHASGSASVFYIDTPQNLDSQDRFWKTQSGVFSVAADETRTFMARAYNYTGSNFYFNWWGGGQMYVEDLGPVP